METIYVIMLKDAVTGFLEKELCSITLAKHDEYIVNLYAAETDDGLMLNIRLSTGRDVSDWEYDAIYDYYDPSALEENGVSLTEMTDDYNPVWLAALPFDEETAQQAVEKVLELHHTELVDVFETIKDKESEYSED
ncbi:MAG: hypothetical protein IKS17_01690 [Firmicutes bacterium]|nr:hypothetical protein [Bacillota bacterium]